MFKGFQSKQKQFNGFPNLNFQMNNVAYGFGGCAFWLDAAYGLNTQTDLAAISKWVERITNLSFEQATAGNQPRLVVSDVTYNNNPVIDFYDTSRRLTSTLRAIIPSSFTVVIVANYASMTGGNNVIGDSSSALEFGLAGDAEGSRQGLFYAPAGIALVSGTTEVNSPGIYILTNTRIVLNGTQESSFSAIRGADIVTFNQIGQRQTLTSRALNGKIAEILIFETELTLGQCQQISSNINQKYALY